MKNNKSPEDKSLFAKALNLFKPTKNRLALFIILLLIFPFPYILLTVSKPVFIEPPENVRYETHYVWSFMTVGDMILTKDFSDLNMFLLFVEIIFLYVLSIILTKAYNKLKTNRIAESIVTLFKFNIKEKILLSLLIFVIFAFMRYIDFPYADIYRDIFFGMPLITFSTFPSLFSLFIILSYLYVLLTLLFYVVHKVKKIQSYKIGKI